MVRVRSASSSASSFVPVAAAIAIAESVSDAELSPDFVVPSVFNRAIVERVAPAVATTAVRDGVIRKS